MSRRSATTTKVFVGSLPPEVTAEDLRKLFTPYGAIAECDIVNRCGFLHLEDRDLAMKAISELNNSTFMGGKITVEKGRIKPPHRGGRGRDGGPMRGGGRDRGGPYSRDGGYGRPRNGFEPWNNRGGGDRFNGRGMGSRGGYDGGYDRRQFDDRRGGSSGFMGDRRPFNGYGDRRPPFEEPPAPYSDSRGGFDGRPGGPPGGYGRDGPMEPPRGGGFDRNGPNAGSNEMFSRRGEPGPKPLMPSGGYGSGTGYSGGGGYSGAPGGYSGSSGGGYGDGRGPSSGGGYSDDHDGSGYDRPSGGYSEPRPGAYGGESRGPTSGSGGYGGNAPYGGGSNSGGYGGSNSGYGGGNSGYSGGSGGGGYGDNYNSNRGNYDASYPPLPWRGGFSSGGGSGPAPRRDMASARRY